MENHGEMEKGTETVILEIEGTKVECDKNLLIKHSDYFSAMFTGNFKERFLKTVKIHDVDLKSFITIQTLIKDAPKTLIIEEAEILCIMHAACILQFSAIRNLCIRRIEFLLKPSNCVNIWKSLELLGVSPLWLKAKCMALMNFDSIKDSNELLEFSIDEICSYLGNVYLYVQNEFSVFRIAMNWWHENQNAYIEEKTKTLLRLINCINFKVLTSDEIGEMQSYSDILNNTDLVAILKLVGELLENHSVVEAKYSSDQLQYAKHLYNSHGRKLLEVPCILFQIVLPVLKSLEEVTNHVHCKNVGVYCNKKNCKFMENIGACFPLGYFAALAYDSISNNFKPCIDMKRDLIKDLGGFKIVSYKEFLVFFGGEYVIGAGKWNFGVWVYDAFKEMWHQISVLPCCRRHFETAIVDGCVFIVGGTGKFRVIQNNMFWYNFVSNKWSQIEPLPSSSRNLKCCCFNGELFVVYLTEKIGYFFDKEICTWKEVRIQLEKDILKNIGEYAAFAHSNYFYIKGNFYFIKFTLEGDQLIPVNVTHSRTDVEAEGTESVSNHIEISCVVVDNIIYSFYKRCDEYGKTLYTLEGLDMETNTIRTIFSDMESDEDFVVCESRMHSLSSSPQLFSVFYYYLVRKNECLKNDIFK